MKNFKCLAKNFDTRVITILEKVSNESEDISVRGKFILLTSDKADVGDCSMFFECIEPRSFIK